MSALKVTHLIVLGHSSCGGVKGFHDMCKGDAPELSNESSFVGKWISILKPGYEKLEEKEADITDRALEKEAVVVSLNNLMTFPFVRDAVESEELSLHGLWTDIGEGGLEFYDVESDSFQPV